MPLTNAFTTRQRPSATHQVAYIERTTLTDGSYVFGVIVASGSRDSVDEQQLDCLDAAHAGKLLDAIATTTNIPCLRDGDVALSDGDKAFA